MPSLYNIVTGLAHYLWGFMISIVSAVMPALAAIMFTGFIIYELDEDWHIKDGAYRDIREMLVGMGLGVPLAMLLKIGLILAKPAKIP